MTSLLTRAMCNHLGKTRLLADHCSVGPNYCTSSTSRKWGAHVLRYSRHARSNFLSAKISVKAIYHAGTRKAQDLLLFIQWLSSSSSTYKFYPAPHFSPFIAPHILSSSILLPPRAPRAFILCFSSFAPPRIHHGSTHQAMQESCPWH